MTRAHYEEFELVRAHVIGRILARIVDLLLSFIVSIIFSQMIPSDWEFPLPIFIGLIYEALFVASDYMATPGKMLMGYKVTTVDGRPLSLLRSMGRALLLIPMLSVYTLSAAAYLVPFLALCALAWRPRRLLHDYLVGSIVVQRAPRVRPSVAEVF